MQLLSVSRSCSRHFMRVFKTLSKFFEIRAQSAADGVRWSGKQVADIGQTESKALRNLNGRQTANIRARKLALPRCGAVGLDQTLAFVMPDRRDSQAGTLCQIADRIFFHISAIICLT